LFFDPSVTAFAVTPSFTQGRLLLPQRYPSTACAVPLPLGKGGFERTDFFTSALPSVEMTTGGLQGGAGIRGTPGHIQRGFAWDRRCNFRRVWTTPLSAVLLSLSFGGLEGFQHSRIAEFAAAIPMYSSCIFCEKILNFRQHLVAAYRPKIGSIFA
jgi:hypothetical protein